MAEFDPDAYLNELNKPAGGGGFDPDSYLKQFGPSSGDVTDSGSLSKHAGNLSRIAGETGKEAWRTTAETAQGVGENLSGAFAKPTVEPDEGFWAGYGRDVAAVPGKAWKFAKGAAGVAGLPLAPVIGAATNLVGREIMAPTIQKLGEYISPEQAKNTSVEQIYEDIRPDVASAVGTTMPGAAKTPAGVAIPWPQAAGKTPPMMTSPPAAGPDVVRQAARNVLDAEGVGYTAGQLSGNKSAQYREAASGTRAEIRRQESLEQLTTAISKRIGENTPNIHEAVQQARPRISQNIENSAKQINVEVTPKLLRTIYDLKNEAIRRGHSPTDSLVKEIEAMGQTTLNAFNVVHRRGKPPGFELPGQSFHELIRKNSHIADSVNMAGPVGMAARQLQRALFDAAEATASPQALAAFRKARREYANLMSIEHVASAAGPDAAAGLLTPSHVRQLATHRHHSDYARGRGDFNDLARASNQVLTTLPNSGTAQRFFAGAPARVSGGMIGGGLGGGMASLPGVAGGTAAGMVAGPWVQGRMIMSRPYQEAAKRRWESRQVKAAARDPQRVRRLSLPMSLRAAGSADRDRITKSNPYAP